MTTAETWNSLSRSGSGARQPAVRIAGETTPQGLRRLTLALIAVLAAGGLDFRLLATSGTQVLGSELVAVGIVAVLTAILALPAPDRIVWPAFAALSPAIFAVGVQPSTTSTSTSACC